MKDRTILQKITETLEAAGIGVSGIETWPEEDGRVSVNLTIRPRPEPKPDPAYTDLYAFIETYLEYDDSRCESVKTVYEEYENSKSPKQAKKLNEFSFIKNVTGYFAARGKEVKFFPSFDIKGKPDPCFSNIRLIRLDLDGPDEKTTAVLDTINADKAPDDPPVVRSPCGECADPDCDICPVKGHAPIKLYDPEEAAAAMLAGRVLLNHLKEKCLWKKWENGRASFCKEDGMGGYSDLFDLSGLYEEAKYV
jgi:hypothetical protein